MSRNCSHFQANIDCCDSFDKSINRLRHSNKEMEYLLDDLDYLDYSVPKSCKYLLERRISCGSSDSYCSCSDLYCNNNLKYNRCCPLEDDYSSFEDEYLYKKAINQHDMYNCFYQVYDNCRQISNLDTRMEKIELGN